MRVTQFFEHHGIARNPFAEEDAQTDPVFKEHCIESTYHPTWDKVYGDPSEPASSVVFGEKGSGKTAMKLQLGRHLEQFNHDHPERQLFVIHYDDFNPFLDRFRDRLSRRNQAADRVLRQWKLWDHMDSILAVAVTGVVDRLLEARNPAQTIICNITPADAARLDRHQARDLLLMAACYDQSTQENFRSRWQRLRKRLKFLAVQAHGALAIGIGWSLAVAALFFSLLAYGQTNWLNPWWVWLLLFVAGWIPFAWKSWNNLWLARSILSRMRVGIRDTASLRNVLGWFTKQELASQPLPNKDSTDDRYELLHKFQSILETLGYKGIIVLVDRVDEPHLINGQAELMKALLWPMLDNKFLKHPGMGLKLMLPIELTRFIEREEREFYQRARLDKQNMITSFEWSGQALYDLANARVKACAKPDANPSLRALFEPGITDSRMLDAFKILRVPRRLFKFLYALIVRHCNEHTDENPAWQISPGTFESALALALRDQDAFDRGTGAG
jgi:hypothetical protein